MTAAPWHWRSILGLGLISGVVQVVAGIVMYLAGVYFAPWSMLVSVLVLLVCIGGCTRQYAARHPGSPLGYGRAVALGAVISLVTGVVYAVYNLISINYFYPGFLDQVAQARVAMLEARQLPHDSLETLRAELSAGGIALPNLVRLTALGSVLSLLNALSFRRRNQAVQ